MDFTRLECRDILANINKTNVDPDVLAKLSIGANIVPTIVIPAIGVPLETQRAVLDSAVQPTTPDGIPPYVPLVYTETELAHLNQLRRDHRSEEYPKGLPPVTQADVAEANRQKHEFHVNEWMMKKNYKPNLNPNDVVNAAFAPPDRPAGYTSSFEKIAVNGVNKYGDKCVRIDADGESVFTCKSGHGYKQTDTLRSCPTCFRVGESASVEEAEDRGAIAGFDSRW